MKNSKLLLTSLLAAATMGTSAYAGFVWNGGETITQALWQTQSSWTLTDGTTWSNGGTGPMTTDSNMWDPTTVADASGRISGLEGWNLRLTLTNASLEIGTLKKFQGGLCAINLDAGSVLTVNNFSGGNDGGSATLNVEGIFNITYGKDQGGDGFTANLGSTGIFNISGAHPAKISSISAKLGNGSSDVLLNIIGGNTVYTRNLVTLSDGATLSNSATYSFTDASDNVLTAVASFGDLDFSKYYAVKDASGYSVSYLVSGISDEVYRWQASGDSSVWSAAVWTKGEATGQNITSDGIAYFGAGDGLASTVTIDAATTVGRLIVDADYIFNGSNYLAMTSGGVVNAGATLILEKSGDGNGGFLRGEIEVAGTLQLNNKDVTGWSNTAGNNLRTITVDVGGVLKLNHSENETFLGTLNLNGTLSGKDANTRWDMYGGNSAIVVAAGANALIDENVKLVIRRNDAPITVGADATLTINGQVLKASLVGQESIWNGVLVKNGAGTLTLDGNVNVDRLNVTAGTTKLSGSAAKTLAVLYGKASTIEIGDGIAETLVATTRLEFGDNNGGTSVLNVKSGSTLAVTGSNNASDYKNASFVLSEWNNSTTATIEGNLLAKDAQLLRGDSAATINVSGGTFAVKGFYAKTSSGSAVTVNVSNDGKLILGSGGVTGIDAVNVTLTDSTFAASESEISFSKNISLVGTGTFSTTKYDFSSDGTSIAEGTGTADITLSGIVSGDGALKKTGAGTLTLSNANIYTGTTTVSAGTLVAGNASALGAGNVVVADGATLARGLTSGSVAVGGTLTTNGAAILSIGALDAGTAAFAVTGDVTLSAGTIFDVDSLVDGGKLVSSAGTLTIADSGTLTKANFLLNGCTLGSRMTFDISTSGNAVTISNVQQNALTLTWFKFDESGSSVWSNGCSGWSYHEGGSSLPSYDETFQIGDSVIFSDDSPVVKNVVVDGAVSVGTMTIDSDADFAFSGQNGAAITSSGALTKSGTGTATIDASVDLSRIGGGIVVEENGGKLVVDTASGYAGAVTAGANGTFTLNVSSDTTLANTLSSFAGTFEKTGAGTLTVSTANTGLTGQFVISEGTVKLGATGNVFGADEREAVVVNEGGTLDVNGKAVFYKVELAGGALVNNGLGIDTNTRQLSGMRLSADSSVISNYNFGLISNARSENELDLAGHTLTKTGSNMFWLVSTNVTAGVIDVREGALVVMNGDSETETFSMDEGALIKINGGELKAGVITNGAYKNVSLGDVAIVLKDATKNTARITGDTECSFNAGGATLYLDIGLLTDAVLTGEQVALTIAAGNAIDSFFSEVQVGTYDEYNVWQTSSEWKYLENSWLASNGTLSITAIPEPSVFGLLAGLGALALAGTRRRRKKA